VANTFVEMMQLQNADFVITHPQGYELNPEITKNSLIEYDQNKAFENADFIYTKTGVVTATMENYQFRSKLTVTAEKMKLTTMPNSCTVYP
jgi:N-succinyl-L-ornithine transcarbamylase